MELARLLRRLGKPLFLAVNKVDSTKLEAEAENFRTLGIENLYTVSAEHGTGSAELLDAVLAAIPPSEMEAVSEAAVEIDPTKHLDRRGNNGKQGRKGRTRRKPRVPPPANQKAA